MFISRPQPTSGALYSEEDFVILTTTEKEKYKCLLPSLTAGEEVSTPNTFWEWHSCLSKELWELATELICTSRARHGAILCCFCTGDHNLPADVRKKDKLWYSCVKKCESFHRILQDLKLFDQCDMSKLLHTTCEQHCLLIDFFLYLSLVNYHKTGKTSKVRELAPVTLRHCCHVGANDKNCDLSCVTDSHCCLWESLSWTKRTHCGTYSIIRAQKILKGGKRQ